MEIVLAEGGPTQLKVLKGLIENLKENGRTDEIQKVHERYADELP